MQKVANCAIATVHTIDADLQYTPCHHQRDATSHTFERATGRPISLLFKSLDFILIIPAKHSESDQLSVSSLALSMPRRSCFCCIIVRASSLTLLRDESHVRLYEAQAAFSFVRGAEICMLYVGHYLPWLV